jgi:serine/threonine protein kinase/tetratricopeptide (TPR) repeat protein
MIALGPFEIHDELARGGMGVVFRGVHARAGVPVAIKVIGEGVAEDPRYAEDFKREVRAAAQIAHPHVVTLFDYGQIGASTAAASGGALVEGSPYLAMELADSGSLERAPDDWPTLRRYLLELLDALAHAHAGGVIHRDLKPANVLLHRGGGERPRVKLADFGIAHASERRDDDHGADLDAIAGTPQYMAPEQIEGRFRDYGPWTDLYALGILTFQLAAGRLPFEATHAVQLLFMHLAEPLPQLAPRFEVPRGLERWIERLCRKKPEERFARAADAAFALASLELAPPRSSAAPADAAPWSAAPADAAPWSARPGNAAPWSAAPADAAPSSASSSSATGPAPWASPSAPPWSAGAAAPWVRPTSDEPPVELPSRAPIPEGWRADEPLPAFLHGAGLGLYFLRPVPLVDREPQRDALWAALHEAEADRRARALVLRGPAGTGKSRLAAWLCERAHETGAALVLRATHQAVPGPSHGLARMLAVHYGCVGLDGRALRAHLVERLATEGVEDAYDREGLAEILDASVAGEELSRRFSVRFASATERHVVIEAALRRAARERPVVVWLDDVQWGADSIAFVEHALASLDAPVVFVLTARDDLLSERHVERERLDALETKATTLLVGPLAEADGATLIERLLGLSGELALRVRKRAEGNPLFAVQLVGDWVQRGVLQPTPAGFALRPGERAELPDDLHTVWIERIERVLGERPSSEAELVELAATLGTSVDRGELDAVVALWARGADFPEPLLDALMRARLIERTEAGFAFAHGMLRESLLRRATEAGRAPRMHLACASMLAAARRRGIAARRGHHLAEAGRLEEALGPLHEAAREHRDQSEYAEALSALARREELAGRLQLADADERWGLGWVLRADVHRLEWDFAAAERWAENALAQAEAHGWSLVRAEALHVLAHVARQRGELDRAQDRNRQALGLFDRLGHDEGRARTMLAMAIVARQQGSFDRAENLYSRAIDLFRFIGDPRGAANALLGLAHVARHHKAYDEAVAKYEEARTSFEKAGYRAGVANCLMGRADVQRYRGELAPAEEAYREALRIQKSLGSKATFIARLNLGLVLLAQDRFAEARATFEGELDALAREGKGAYLGWAHTMLLPCVVATHDADAFDRHLEAALAHGAVKAMVDEDMAAAAERAGLLLRDAGDEARARRALELAAQKWRALGDEERARRLEG